MKLEKVIAVRTDKTIYRDGDKTVKVFERILFQGKYFERGAQPCACGGNRPGNSKVAWRSR